MSGGNEAYCMIVCGGLFRAAPEHEGTIIIKSEDVRKTRGNAHSQVCFPKNAHIFPTKLESLTIFEHSDISHINL